MSGSIQERRVINLNYNEKAMLFAVCMGVLLGFSSYFAHLPFRFIGMISIFGFLVFWGAFNK